MNQSTDQLYAEYILLASKLDAIRGGRFRAGGYKKHYNEMYDKASLLHLELIARGAMLEKPRGQLGGKTNSEVIKRGTISYPNRKKLGKKKKGGRRRV